MADSRPQPQPLAAIDLIAQELSHGASSRAQSLNASKKRQPSMSGNGLSSSRHLLSRRAKHGLWDPAIVQVSAEEHIRLEQLVRPDLSSMTQQNLFPHGGSVSEVIISLCCLPDVTTLKVEGETEQVLEERVIAMKRVATDLEKHLHRVLREPCYHPKETLNLLCHALLQTQHLSSGYHPLGYPTSREEYQVSDLHRILYLKPHHLLSILAGEHPPDDVLQGDRQYSRSYLTLLAAIHPTHPAVYMDIGSWNPGVNDPDYYFPTEQTVGFVARAMILRSTIISHLETILHLAGVPKATLKLLSPGEEGAKRPHLLRRHAPDFFESLQRLAIAAAGMPHQLIPYTLDKIPGYKDPFPRATPTVEEFPRRPMFVFARNTGEFKDLVLSSLHPSTVRVHAERIDYPDWHVIGRAETPGRVDLDGEDPYWDADDIALLDETCGRLLDGVGVTESASDSEEESVMPTSVLQAKKRVRMLPIVDTLSTISRQLTEMQSAPLESERLTEVVSMISRMPFDDLPAMLASLRHDVHTDTKQVSDAAAPLVTTAARVLGKLPCVSCIPAKARVVCVGMFAGLLTVGLSLGVTGYELYVRHFADGASNGTSIL